MGRYCLERFKSLLWRLMASYDTPCMYLKQLEDETASWRLKDLSLLLHHYDPVSALPPEC